MTKHILRIAAVSVSLLTPLSATSASLSIHDSIAGLGTQAEISGLPDGAYELTLVPPIGRVVSQPFRSDADGSTSVFVSGNHTEHAGLYSASVTQQGKNVVTGVQFEILPDSVDIYASTVSVQHGHIVADGRDEAEVTVTLRDRFGNPLPGRPMELIGSTGLERIQPFEPETDTWGEQHFAVSVQSPGLVTVRALDLLSGKILAAVGQIEAQDPYGVGGHEYRSYAPYPSYQGQVIPRSYAQEAFDELHTFEITFDPPRLGVNEVAKNIFIKALDRNGNTVEDYTGTVRVYSPTDPDANLPGFENGYGEVTFIAQERGVKRLPLVVSFSREGRQVLRAEDAADPSNILFGEATVQVGEGGGIPIPGSIDITSHADGDGISNRAVTVEGVGPALTPLEILVNDKVVGNAVADADGNWVADIDLDVTIIGAFTLFVQDESGRERSAKIRLEYDPTKPVISSLKVTPAEAEEGSEALIVVKTEPNLFEVVMTVAEEEFPLEENSQEPGTYQLLFEVPAPGTYDVQVLVRDKAGNETEDSAPLSVIAEGLPVVQNVKASARANAVDLTWDLVPDVDTYRIYIGEAADAFDFTLDTAGRATTSATVAGLKPGTTYYFAVTAVQGDRESREKSETVSAVALGTALKVAAQESSLLLEWSFPSEVPLSSFLLEYGAKGGTTERYTEKRILNGSLRAFTLRDLLSGVTYILKLTPIAATGDPLTDLTAKGEGTPIGEDGFHPAPADSGSFDPDDLPPPNYHQGAPRTPTTGIPSIALWLAGSLCVFVVLLQWHRRRTLRLTAEFLKTIEEQYRNF
ncbi:fibronectin type III domain-containing protein [Candidatus Peregrinibacteria bacterium]|nr:fibronectin type III domain-containing protein [Candidatus Peregrinibacteria bacterium]